MTEQSTAALDEAAAEAVEEQVTEQPAEEAVEEVEEQEAATEEPVEEPVEEQLPKEHEERSNLGRKLSAYHRRVDEIDNVNRQMLEKLDRLASYLDPANRDNSQTVDPDEPLTYSDWKRLSAEQEAEKERQQKQYDDKYRSTVSRLGSDLTDNEWQDIVNEMSKMPLDSSGNPDIDAERNFHKAATAYYRNRVAQPVEKKNPVEGRAKPTGVAPAQKTVVKEAKKPKLDSYAQSYYEYIERTDGEEAAKEKTKDI